MALGTSTTDSPPQKKIPREPQPRSSRWRCTQLRAEVQKDAVCIEKNHNQKPQDSSFAYLALLAVPEHVARPGHAVQPRGRGGLIPAAVPAKEKGGYFGCFLFCFCLFVLFCLVSKEKKKYSLFVLLEFIIFTRISLFVFWGRHEFIKSIKEIVK